VGLEILARRAADVALTGDGSLVAAGAGWWRLVFGEWYEAAFSVARSTREGDISDMAPLRV
jgi:hypothetical protein